MSIVFFSGDITETLFSSAAETTTMSEATLPTVTIDVGGNEINLLHGYSANLDPMIIRESITPITDDKTFTLLIHHTESDVKKLKYEILSEDGQALEAESLTVLDVIDGPKKVPITLHETLKSGQEYVAKFTLITNNSKRIYYYTRLKLYSEGMLDDKLQFADFFHDTLLYGEASDKEQLKRYLEPARNYDNSSFAHVTIKSSFDMVTWGELKPTVIYEQVPTITEFYNNIASVRRQFVVSIETGSGLEYYDVKEDFRFQYTPTKTYLYNYERDMNAQFDVAHTSLVKNEFKLGITSDTEAQAVASDSGKYMAFVYGCELLVYDIDNNSFFKAFSFKDGSTDYERDHFDNHDIKILRVYDTGNVDFIVYGYMNRGEYEGRVGMVLYRFIIDDNRFEEQLYVPINTSYWLLLADMTDFMFLSEFDVFYFSLYDSVYSYSLVTREVKCLAENVPDGNMVFVENELYLVWQSESDLQSATQLQVFDLKENEIRKITAPKGETIRLLGRINDNFIYGYQKLSDKFINLDGSVELPSYKLCISDGDCNVLKEYSYPDIWIRDVEPGDGILMINRVKKRLGELNTYYETTSDSIVNLPTAIVRSVGLSRRVTDRILTEYYVTVPSGVDITSVPVQFCAVPTVIDFDTTTRVSEPEDKPWLYYAYSFSEISFASLSAGKAIAVADEKVGTVINKDGRLIWERGVKSTRSEIAGLQPVKADSDLDSRQAAMKMLLRFKNINTDTSTYNYEKESLYSWLFRNMKSSVVDLTGVTLDEMLYYVYKGRPVIAMRPDGNAVVVTGYDATTVTLYEPSRASSRKYSLKEAHDMFESAGNVFISYVD